MGWDFGFGDTKAKLVTRLTKAYHPCTLLEDPEGYINMDGKRFSYGPSDPLRRLVCLHHAVRPALDGQSALYKVWSIQRRESEDAEWQEEGREIGVDLLCYDRGLKSWGYKSLSESMGPYCTNCPVEYFDLVPESSNEYAREWRVACRETHRREQAAKAIVPGTVLRFSEPVNFSGGAGQYDTFLVVDPKKRHVRGLRTTPQSNRYWGTQTLRLSRDLYLACEVASAEGYPVPD